MLAIVVLAALITPTPDVVNLMLFSLPMVLLYFVGIFASICWYLAGKTNVSLGRTFLIALLIPILLIAAGVYVAITCMVIS